jgi:hypothetical protein
MFHFHESITNTRGDALTGYFVRAVDADTGEAADIFADSSATPIVSVSEVANAAQVDDDGMVSFWIASGEYHLDIYAADSTTSVRRFESVPMADIPGDFDKLLGIDIGAIPDGVGSDLTVSRSFSGVGSSSGLYGHNEQITSYGSGQVGAVRTNYFGINLQATALTGNATGTHQYVWMQGSGDLTDAIVQEAHFRADGPGTIINSVRLYNTAGTTLGGITIPSITGYNAGELTDATNGGVVTTAIGFNHEHCQAGTKTIAFRSQQRAVSGAFSHVAETNDGSAAAPAVFSGKVKVGSASPGVAVAPSWDFHVIANADDWAAVIQNRTGTSPYGLRIESTNAAPRNRTVKFLTLVDTGGELVAGYSNGDIDSVGKLRSISAVGGIGYGTGAGSTVTQATGKSTGVTLNAPCGQVTMNNGALAAGAKASFVVTNSQAAATDVIAVSVASGGTANAYRAAVTAVAAGSFTVTVENITAGSLSEAPVISFAIIKAVAA